jgi:hypothetical protein
MAALRRRTRPPVDDHAPGGASRRTRARACANRLIKGRANRALVLIVLGALVALGGVAIAAPSGEFVSSTGATGGLVKNGPVSPANGFPAWYRDSTGLDLEGCMSALDPNCGAVPVPDPTQPPSFPGNFPDEFFYMLADANLTTGSGSKVLAEFALEGAFANGGVVAGDQMAFSRIRFRIDSGLQGSTDYKITHPYGVDIVKSGPNPADKPDIFVTQDVGITPGAFSEALGGRVGPFLQWTPPATPGDVPPAGYIGDAATPHTVTGSAAGTNFVRIEGPGIGGANNPNPCTTTGANAYTGDPANCIETDLFTLTGKKSTTGGVDVARASYSRPAAGGPTQVDVFAASKAAQDIVVRDPAGGATPAFPITPLREQDGRYYARVTADGPLPATVEVVNRGDIPQTVKTVNVTDVVTGSAAYDTATGTLHVQGLTSDKSPSAGELSVPQFAKTLDATGAGDIALDAPPDVVTIASTKGGKMTVPVEASGAALAPLPLVANAGPDQTVEQGVTVKLDAGNSTGNITGYKWSAPAGVALTSTDTKATTFVATSPGDFTITLAVTGIDGTPPASVTQLDTVNVHVNPPAVAPVARVAPIGPLVAQNWPVELDGTPSTGAATFQWSYEPAAGDPAITLGATDQSKLTFTFPKTTRTLMFRLRVCTAAVPAVCDSTTGGIAGQSDPLTIARARFNGGRWVVAGTATSILQNSVTVHAGSTLTGAVIGTVPVDALGGWQLDVRNSPVAANTRVSVESARGGELLDQAVR